MPDQIQQQQIPPKRIEYPMAIIGVEHPDPQQVVLTIGCPAPNEVVIVRLDAETAAKVGAELIGNRFVVAGPNDIPKEAPNA